MRLDVEKKEHIRARTEKKDHARRELLIQNDLQPV